MVRRVLRVCRRPPVPRGVRSDHRRRALGVRTAIRRRRASSRGQRMVVEIDCHRKTRRKQTRTTASRSPVVIDHPGEFPLVAAVLHCAPPIAPDGFKEAMKCPPKEKVSSPDGTSAASEAQQRSQGPHPRFAHERARHPACWAVSRCGGADVRVRGSYDPCAAAASRSAGDEMSNSVDIPFVISAFNTGAISCRRMRPEGHSTWPFTPCVQSDGNPRPASPRPARVKSTGVPANPVEAFR